jgi:hypothetical protein
MGAQDDKLKGTNVAAKMHKADNVFLTVLISFADLNKKSG